MPIAPGRKQRVQHAAVKAPDDDPFDHESDERRYDERKRDGDQNAGVQPDARHHRRVRADHHQFAMGHVDDAHNAVGDRKPQRHQKQNGADAQPDEQSIDHGITNAAAGRRGGRMPVPDQVFLSFVVSSPLDVQNRLSSVSP